MKYPFTPELLDALPEEMARLFRGLEDRLLEEICSRLRISGQLNEVTVQDIRALRSHGIDLKTIEKAIREVTGISQKKLDELLADVVRRNQAFYTDIATLAAVTVPDSFVSAQDIDAIVRQTKGELKNLTQSLGFLVRRGGAVVESLPPAKAYQWALDQAELEVMSGAVSYNQAISHAVKQLADSGIRAVRYEAGGKVKYDHADVAARRAVMTGVNQTCQKYAEQSVEYLETDVVEVSAHKGARNTGFGPENHAAWQGRLYSLEGQKYPNFRKVTGYGTGEGLGGWNCRHHFYPFVDGVMERTYTDEELESMENPPFEYQGKTYDQYAASQKQREIEREVRRYKREQAAFEAAGLTGEATAAKIRIRNLNAQYRDFSKAAGLPMQKERMKVLAGDERSTAKAVALSEVRRKAQRIEVEKYSALKYDSNGQILVTDDWTNRPRVTIPKKYKPNAVLDTLSRGGKQHDRTIYGADAMIVKQVHGGHHGHPKQHPFGKNGEHVHDFKWDTNGEKPERPARNASDKEVIEHRDILGGSNDNR